jgi:hypothetical protein
LVAASQEPHPSRSRFSIETERHQEGAGAVVAVCRGSIACPVAAVRDWLAGASITEGPVFRPVGKGGRLLPNRLTPQNVALIVKAYAARLRLGLGARNGP